MSATLYYTALVPSAVTPTTEAAGYDADNILTTSVARAWRSTSVAGTTTLIIDLGSSKAVAAIALNHVNLASMVVKADNSATPSTARGTLTTAEDGQGRRKGMLAFSATVRYIMLEFTGTPTDAAAFWTVGSAYVFAASAALPVDPLYGSDVQYEYPQSVQSLPNGRDIRIDRGVPRAVWRMRFNARAASDIEALARRARAGSVWLDLGISGSPQYMYPFTHIADSIGRQFAAHNREQVQIPLRELA